MHAILLDLFESDITELEAAPIESGEVLHIVCGRLKAQRQNSCFVLLGCDCEYSVCEKSLKLKLSSCAFS
jgi:hypothetical protein